MAPGFSYYLHLSKSGLHGAYPCRKDVQLASVKDKGALHCWVKALSITGRECCPLLGESAFHDWVEVLYILFYDTVLSTPSSPVGKSATIAGH